MVFPPSYDRPVSLTDRHLVQLADLIIAEMARNGVKVPARQVGEARQHLLSVREAEWRELLARLSAEAVDRTRKWGRG